jgi:hypothetical protein
MADLHEGIVQQYAEHLLAKGSSVVRTWTVSGAIFGLVLGAIPAFLHHSIIAPGANYFAVLLGAVAGGIVGRSLGEKRAIGLRFQAQMALRQLEIESRFVVPAPVARQVEAAPAPVAAPAQVAPAPVAVEPVVAPPAASPSVFAPPLAAPAPVTPAPEPAPVTPAPVAPAPEPAAEPLVPLAPAPLTQVPFELPPSIAPAPVPAPLVAAPPPVPPTPPAPAVAAVPSPGPRLLDQSALPPLTPPLSAGSNG